VSYQEAFDTLCTLLEDYADADVETRAEQIFGYLGLTGMDLLEHLDPPPGMQRWLDSHGLSLVVTRETPAPRVWAALEEDDDEVVEGEIVPSLEERAEEVSLQVGDYVEYRTAAAGPRGQSLIGSGRICSYDDDGVYVDIGGSQVWLDRYQDVIRRVTPPHTA
jgi:hypothetical protein